MQTELGIEDRAELIKAAFLDELGMILLERREMSKTAQVLPVSAARAARAARAAAATQAASVARAEAAARAAAAARAEGATQAAAGARAGQPAAAAAGEVPPGAPPPPPPVGAAAAAGEVPPGAPPGAPAAAAAGAVPGGEALGAQLGLLDRWRMAGMRPSNWRHFLIPAAAGIGTTMATGSPEWGLAAGLGTFGLGRLGRIGRGPTAMRQAMDSGEQAWRSAMAQAGGDATKIPGRAVFQEKALRELTDVMQRNPIMAEEYYRAAAPSYLRGAAIAVPSAVGLGLWGGKKAIEGITDTGEGGQGNFLQNAALAAGGTYAGKQLAEWAAQQGYIPDWAQWPAALGLGAMAPRVVGG